MLACLLPPAPNRIGAAAESAPDGDSATVITSFDEYWRSGLRDAVRPIRVEMTVNYYDPAWGHLWGEIGGEIGYLRSAPRLPIQSFDRIRVEGRVVPNLGLSPGMVTLDVLERGVEVRATDATGRLADFDGLRSRYVTCDVIVGEEDFSDGNHLVIEGVAEGHRVHVYQWMEPPRLLDLGRGSTIRVSGVYNANRKAETGMVEIDLWVGRPQDIVPPSTGRSPSPAVAAPAPEASGHTRSTDPATIRTFGDYWREGLRNVPRRLEATMVVTYYDPAWGNLWGVIDNEPGFINAAPKMPIRSRDRILLEGTAVPEHGLSADATRVTILESNVPFDPIDANGRLDDVERLRSRIVTCNVEVTGESTTDDGHVLLEGLAGGRKVHIFHWTQNPQPLGIRAGSVVEVTGLYHPTAAADPASPEIDLWVARREDIVIPDPALASAAGREPEAAEREPEAVRSFGEFWIDEFRRTPRPIEMEMLVLYYDSRWGLLWGDVEGTRGFIQVTPGKTLPMRSRDRVRLTGSVIAEQGLSPDRVQVEVLARDVPVRTIDAAGRMGEFTTLGAQIVTCEVLVDEETLSETHHLILDGTADDMRVHVFLQGEPAQPLNLPEGATVRATGVYSAKHDPKTESLEVDLWVARPEDVVVTGNIASDPRFAERRSAIGDIYTTDGTNAAPVVIAGVVREHVAGRQISVRDETGQIIVRSKQVPDLQIGDIVEAWGVPFTLGAEPVLRGAVIRRAAPPVANEVLLRIGGDNRLRMAEQVLGLGVEAAAEGRPVELSGIVVWASHRARTVILRDATGGVRVDLQDIAGEFPKPQYGIRIRGVTTAGDFAPGVRARSIVHWGTALLPEPVLLTLDQARTGLEEGQMVEMRGLVKDVQSDDRWARLRLSTPTGEFTARLERRKPPTHLVGSMVAVRGVCQATANERRQLTGIEIWCTSDNNSIRIEQEAPADPFSVPLRRIGALRQFNPKATLQFWARVRGVVTHHSPGRFVFLQDGTEGLLLLSSQRDRLAPGDQIEATGLPGFESDRVVLREAVFRRIGRQEELAPVDLTQPRRMDDHLESRLVRVRGVLVTTVTEPAAISLTVNADDTVFNAALARTAAPAPDRWQPGSRVELTGVYELVRDERRQPSGFRLQLRSAEDVAILARPPWWTPERAWMTLAGLTVCFSGGLAWLVALRRRVYQQTRQIREQVAKEAKLEARHRDIFEKASDFIFTTDRDGRFTSFNPAGERITGYPAAEALTMNLRDLMASANGDSGLLQALDVPQDRSVTFQGQLETRDGRTIWAETSARLVFEGGEFTGVLGVIRDISERKRFEEELKQARDAAESATEAKSAFLANMSHEIRTPMNGVIGMTNLLLDTTLNDDQRAYAETIRNSGEALLTVLNDILDFSKIEAGKLHLETVEFDLVDNIEETVDLLAERAAAKQLQLAAIIEPGLPPRLRGDPGRIRQVMLNLLGNAVKFTERGEVTVSVRREAESETAVTLHIAVSDTGIGIGEQARLNLFRPFMQADNSTTRRFGGTGLGLAISKQLVELLGGTIGVDSTPGSGSTFWFKLEFEKAPALPEAAAPVPPPPGRILAVDTHANSRRALAASATACGLSLDLASSPSDALERLARAAAADASYRAVFIDADVSGETGIALARQIAARPGPKPALILLRPFDRWFSAEELVAAGVESVIKKPVRRRDLLATVNGALNPDARRAEAPVAGPPAPAAPAEPLKILVAEDNAVNQRLIVLQLKKLGHTADVAADGLEALDALSRVHYDLVLMDCQMPEMDGYEATRRIRRNERFAGLRIVAMTANAMRGDREKCLAAGMDDYLSKPVRMDKLRAALDFQPAARPAEPVAQPV